MITIKDFTTWYDENKNIKPAHKADMSPINPDFPIADNGLIVLLGMSGSGKSFAIKEILKRVPFDVVVFTSPTQLFDQTFDIDIPGVRYTIHATHPNEGVEKTYMYKMRVLNVKTLFAEYEDELNQYCPDNKILVRIIDDIIKLTDMEEYLEENSLVDTLATIRDIYNENNRVISIFDDCGYESGEMKRGDNIPSEEMAMIKRHLGITVAFCLQDDSQLKGSIKSQRTDTFFTKGVNKKTLELSFDKLGCLTDYRNIIPYQRHFVSLHSEVCVDKEYGSLGVLYGGITVDFELKTSNELRDLVISGMAKRTLMAKDINERVKQEMRKKLIQ